MALNAAPSESEESEDEQYASSEEPLTNEAPHPHNTRQRQQVASLGGPELLREPIRKDRLREPIHRTTKHDIASRESRDLTSRATSKCDIASRKRKPNVPSSRLERSNGDRDDVTSRSGKNARPTVTNDRPIRTTRSSRTRGAASVSPQPRPTTQSVQPYSSDEEMAVLGGDEYRSCDVSSGPKPDLHDAAATSNRPGTQSDTEDASIDGHPITQTQEDSDEDSDGKPRAKVL
jgi:hypothetical protein